MAEKKNINILNNVLVPKHTIISEDEKEDLLNRLNIAPKQLPKISASDPVIKTIEGKAGDIIKIVRKSPTAGITAYYRIVV